MVFVVDQIIGVMNTDVDQRVFFPCSCKLCASQPAQAYGDSGLFLNFM